MELISSIKDIRMYISYFYYNIIFANTREAVMFGFVWFRLVLFRWFSFDYWVRFVWLGFDCVLQCTGTLNLPILLDVIQTCCYSPRPICDRIMKSFYQI